MKEKQCGRHGCKQRNCLQDVLQIAVEKAFEREAKYRRAETIRYAAHWIQKCQQAACSSSEFWKTRLSGLFIYLLHRINSSKAELLSTASKSNWALYQYRYVHLMKKLKIHWITEMKGTQIQRKCSLSWLQPMCPLCNLRPGVQTCIYPVSETCIYRPSCWRQQSSLYTTLLAQLPQRPALQKAYQSRALQVEDGHSLSPSLQELSTALLSQLSKQWKGKVVFCIFRIDCWSLKAVRRNAFYNRCSK